MRGNVKNINPTISDALERVIEHAVKYKPEERYLTALEMKEDLIAILQNKSGISGTGNSIGDDSDLRTSGGIFAVKPVWVFACEDEIRNTPLYHNDIVYIGSYDRNLYALDANSGRMIWKSPTEAGITTKPAIFEHSIFVGSEDHNLYAISDRTGAVDWKYTTGDAIRSSPRIHNKVIYVGSDDGCMHAINATSGNTLWKTETSGPIRSSVYIDEDRLYFGGEEGEFYCMEVSGNIKWRNKTKRSITSSASSLPGRSDLFIVGRIFVCSRQEFGLGDLAIQNAKRIYLLTLDHKRLCIRRFSGWIPVLCGYIPACGKVEI